MLFITDFIRFASRCLYLLILACPLSAFADQDRSITVYITVDWEGWSLDEENLETMDRFREQHPHIPMVHLLNPAYFTQSGADSTRITAQIRRTLRPNDVIGLHLHGWRSLVEYCGLSYQNTPTFAEGNEGCNVQDCGYTVSLELAYDQPALAQLLDCSAKLLDQHGFGRPRHFRAGGWQLGPNLAAALHAQDFIWDSSSIDAKLIAGAWGEQSALVQQLKSLHPHATTLDQPVTLLPGLMHFPNNAGLADYTSTDQIVRLFQALLDAHQSVMVTGFHQETAFVFLDRLAEAIPRLETAAQAAGVKLHWGKTD